MRQASIDRITKEIADVGALTRSLAERYEGIFRIFRAEVQDMADEAPSLSAAAHAVLIAVDAAAATLSASLPNQPPIDCAAGCAACCHLFVAVPPGIAPLIHDYVTTHFTLEERDQLIGRLQAAQAAAERADKPLRLRRPCPLLGSDHRCTVYPVRPISCRAFTSASATHCHGFIFGGAEGGGIDQNPAIFRLHREATAALEQTAGKREQPAVQRGLADALLAEMIHV